MGLSFESRAGLNREEGEPSRLPGELPRGLGKGAALTDCSAPPPQPCAGDRCVGLGRARQGQGPRPCGWSPTDTPRQSQVWVHRACFLGSADLC